MGFVTYIGVVLVTLVFVWGIQFFLFAAGTRLFRFPGANFEMAFRTYLFTMVVCAGVKLVLSGLGVLGPPSIAFDVITNLILLGVAVGIVQTKYGVGFVKAVGSWAFPVIFGALLALGFREYVTQGFRSPTTAMRPSLEVGDNYFVSKFSYRIADPERGDIVVFDRPGAGPVQFVMRIVGLPGETIEIKNNIVLIGNEPLKDPWGHFGDYPEYSNTSLPLENFGPIEIATGEYFMLGDNRWYSQDSRFWGTVPDGSLSGKVMLRYWPLWRLGWSQL